jgi:Holliday junction resolvasome RuvABC endonuclease subunit
MISIDASTNKTGLAIYDNGIYKEVDLIDCSEDSKMDSRFQEMAKRVYRYLEEKKPYILYMEETVVKRNASTQRFLTRLQGVIYAYCINNDCEFNTIRPTEWRMLVGMEQGKKNREELKAEAVAMVLDKFGIAVSDDEAEAILIGLAVLEKFKRYEK